MRLFHLTYEENLPSIEEHGLVPFIGERARLVDENVKKVSFFESFDKAIIAYDNWLMPHFDSTKPMVVIEVEVSEKRTKKDGNDYPILDIVKPESIVQVYTLNHEPLWEEKVVEKVVAPTPKLKF